MELLNNLWIAISTPNEILMNIIAIPAGLMESYLIMLLYISILNISSTKKQKILCVFLMTIVGLTNTFFVPNPFNVFINYILMILIAYFIFKLSFLKSTISIIISCFVFNIIGALILNPFLTIANINSDILSQVPMYRLIYVFIIYTFVYLIILLLKYQHFKIDFLDNVDKRTKQIIIANIVLGIITFIVQSIITFYYIDKLPILITFLSFISLVTYFILSIYSLTRVFKLTLTTQKLQSAEEYNNSLRILHDNVRGFKHDFDNIVTTIGGYIKTNDMEGLKKYYIQLEDDCQRVNNLYVLNPEVVNNDGIYNLLTKKYNEAESKDIKVNITFLLDLGSLNMKIYEFARILGILLDNAIEASSECNDKKIINLIFRNDTKNSRQLVIIENTYNNKNIDIEKMFEKGFSEKENHTGFGLWEVRKIIKKNNNINLFTTKNETFLSQQLEIYY